MRKNIDEQENEEKCYEERCYFKAFRKGLVPIFTAK